jgi:hypothetical protein
MTILQMILMLLMFCRALRVPGKPVLEFERSLAGRVKNEFQS